MASTTSSPASTGTSSAADGGGSSSGSKVVVETITATTTVVTGVGSGEICAEYSANCTAAVAATSAGCSSRSFLCSLPTADGLPSGECGYCLCNDANLIEVLQCDIISTYSLSSSSSKSTDTALLSNSTDTHSASTSATDGPPPGEEAFGTTLQLGPMVGGIVVGVAVACFAIVAVVYMRRRRRKPIPSTAWSSGAIFEDHGKDSSSPSPFASPSSPYNKDVRLSFVDIQAPPSALRKDGGSDWGSLFRSSPSPAQPLAETGLRVTDQGTNSLPRGSPSPAFIAREVQTSPDNIARNIQVETVSNSTEDAPPGALVSNPTLSPSPEGEFERPLSMPPSSSFNTGATSTAGGAGGALVLSQTAESSDGPSPPAEWSQEQQWQWMQWQWAYQWHEWQISQRQWQDQQRAYYLAKEEERKKAASSASAGSSTESAIMKHKLPRAYKPSPLSRVSRFSVSTANSDSSQSLSRRLSYESSASAQFVTTIRPPSRQSSVSTMSSVASMSIIATSPEWAAPADLTRSGSSIRGRKPLSRSSSSNPSPSAAHPNHRRSRSLTAHSSQGPPPGSFTAMFTTKFGPNAAGGPTAEPVGMSADIGHLAPPGVEAWALPPLPQASITTSSSSFMYPVSGNSDDAVSVISITSTAPDGSMVTTQTISVPRPISPTSLNTGVASISSASLSPSILSPPAGADFAGAAHGTHQSPRASLDSWPRQSMDSGGVTAGDPSDGGLQMPYPVLVAHPRELHRAVRIRAEAVSKGETPAYDRNDAGAAPVTDNNDEDDEDDELVLEVGHHVVIWRVCRDGFCDGYCSETRRAGFFPLRCVVGSSSSPPRNGSMRHATYSVAFDAVPERSDSLEEE
ncbi:hypothetical protein HK405_010772 [Cladochytrium tenue]|nr:hypothetical protein HK405_010772 [Cladochytrium tenue]